MPRVTMEDVFRSHDHVYRVCRNTVLLNAAVCLVAIPVGILIAALANVTEGISFTAVVCVVTLSDAIRRQRRALAEHRAVCAAHQAGLRGPR
jgi:hypothetical protein